MSDPRVQTIWWVGFWRAGEHVYWWTTAVSPTGERAQVRADVRDRVAGSTWRETVDPGVAAPGPVPADAAFVAAGAIAWAELEPHLTSLAAAVPVQTDAAVRQETEALTRRRRRVREIAAMTLTSPTEEESATLLAEQIALGRRSASLNRAAVLESLARAWSGPLVDPDTNTRLCRELGLLLLPAVLREYLAAAPASPHPPAATVVVAPAPELGLVPWELLTVDADARLIERASVRGGLGPATVADLALPAAEDRPDLPGLLVLDPARAGRRHDPVPIYPHGVPEIWRNPERSVRGDLILSRPPASAAGSDGGDPGCSRRRMGALLREARWGRFVFHGHVGAADALSPTAAALVLADDPDDPDTPVTTRDGRALEEPSAGDRLSARVWLHLPRRWPVPRRVGIIACQADDAGYVEQTGLTLAALNAGARIVTTTRWTLPGDATARTDPSEPGPTTAVALAVDEALRAADPAAALREWQLGELDAWRGATTPAARRAHAPLLWAALVTYTLPDTVASTPLEPAEPGR